MRRAATGRVQHRFAGRSAIAPGFDARTVGAFDVLVFLVELGLLAAVAVAGARLGSGALAVALAVMLPLLVATLWALCLAPRAVRRLRRPSRLAVKLALIVAGAGLLAVSGAVLWGVGFLAVTAPLVTIGELRAPASPRS